jgi:hypothetical protein
MQHNIEIQFFTSPLLTDALTKERILLSATIVTVFFRQIVPDRRGVIASALRHMESKLNRSHTSNPIAVLALPLPRKAAKQPQNIGKSRAGEGDNPENTRNRTNNLHSGLSAYAADIPQHRIRNHQVKTIDSDSDSYPVFGFGQLPF